MTITQNPSVTLADVSFAWPDGTAVFDGISASFGTGRTSLVGSNGTGKTTLLRLIRGDLTPTAGSLTLSGRVGYLPQNLTLDTSSTVADLLGIRRKVDALHAIETGDTDERHYEALGEDWDVEARASASLDTTGVRGVGLDRRAGTLSGGEAMLCALTGLRLSGEEIVLLDEPTNNLDRAARHGLYDAITAWRGAVIVVSHDVTLLDLMDDTAELHSGSLAVHGGNYRAYREHLAQEQAAAEQALRTAAQHLRSEKRQRVESQTKLARRQRSARTDYANKRKPKVVMNQRKTQAQVSAGKLRAVLDVRVQAARRDAREQAERVRQVQRIRIDLPDPSVHATRRLAELRDNAGFAYTVQGPERVALVGRNGVGKTRLLETLFHPGNVEAGLSHAVGYTDRIGYLPQRLDHLDDTATVFDAVSHLTRSTPDEQVRANLARFLFRGETFHAPVGTLSGGERFRVALAQLLLAEPAHQLLVLDEPTNNAEPASRATRTGCHLRVDRGGHAGSADRSIRQADMRLRGVSVVASVSTGPLAMSWRPFRFAAEGALEPFQRGEAFAPRSTPRSG